MSSIDQIDPATLATIAKAIKVSLASRRPAPGVHEVAECVTFDIVSEVKVSEDSERTPTVSVPLLPTLALFIRYSGVTGPTALRALERAMREAIEAGEGATEAIAEVADIEACEARVVAAMQALPKVPKKGAVSVRKGYQVKAV
jgi:hypothetical protein